MKTVKFQVSQTYSTRKGDQNQCLEFSFQTEKDLNWQMLIKNVYQRVKNVMSIREATGKKIGFSLAQPFQVTCTVDGLAIDTTPLSSMFKTYIKYSNKRPESFKNTFEALVYLGQAIADEKDYSAK